MKKFSILSGLLLFIAITTKGQINLRPGYIITNLNDTIRGMIDFRTSERNTKVCSFRSDTSTTIKHYQPGEIYAYRFSDDGKFYVTRHVTINEDPEVLFLEYLIKGNISLYYCTTSSNEYYFFEDENGRLFKISNDEYEIEVNGRFKTIYNPRYIGLMTWLFNKSDNIKKKLEHLHINRSDLSKITKQYHYETCQTNEDCIEFESKPDTRFFKAVYSIQAGIRIHTLYLQDAETLWNIGDMRSLSPSLTAGIDVSIPRLTNMASMKAEVELSSLKGEKNNFVNDNTYHKFYLKAYTTDIRIGLAIKLSKISFCPSIEGGFCETFLWGTDVYHTSAYRFNDYILQYKKDHNDDIYRNYTGYYVSAGIQIPLKKRALLIKGLFEQRRHKNDEITTWGINIGYVF